jgi:ketosteroid isomerase-like protein
MGPAEEKQATETIVANLSAALDRWYSGDPFGYAGLFAEDITYFDPLMNDRLETMAQLRDHYGPIEGTVDLPRFELLEPKLQWEGDVGILTYFLKQYTSDGPVGPTWKTTEVYRRFGEDWRAIHAHWSTIPETG